MVRRLTREEIRAQIRAARAAGRAAQREPWWPVDVRYEHAIDSVVVALRGGKSVIVPRSDIRELTSATRAQLERVELAGEAICWDELDVDVSVPGLLSELLGPTLSAEASGRLGGRSRSRAKSAAARANGRKGGRPRRRRS